jgi:Pyruvate/2-oxoacid:ferredoxin oxidoreductase delta subunit
MRVVPVSKTIEDSRQVLPFDALKPMIEAASYRAVAMCPCRQMVRYAGEGCDHSLEVCMHFGSMGRYMVEQGMARELDVEETLQILDESNKEGLVHAADNIEGYLSTLCNCCGCCCNFITAKKRMGIHALSPSNYVSRIEADACTSCGICEELCPMDAVTLNGEGIAQVDESRCIGCGVCAGTCEFDAVELVLRGEVIPPPSVQEFLAARLRHG